MTVCTFSSRPYKKFEHQITKPGILSVATIGSAESVGTNNRTLRKYGRDHLDANEFLERQKKDVLNQSHINFISAAATQRLIDVLNDEKNRGYFFVQTLRVYLGLLIEVLQIERTLRNTRY